MEAKTSQSLYGQRGAGGKFKKPPSRKPPATPYGRPPAAPASRIRSNGWLSKLVDPAYQLISGSATRILSSFFSKSPSDSPPLLPIALRNGTGVEAEVTPNSRDEENCTPCHVSRSTEGMGASEQLDTLTRITECQTLEQEKPETSDSAISRIEQLMKGKEFSRDEIIHLIEILNSKVVDEQEKNKTCMTAERDNEGTLLLHDTPRKSSERKLENMARALPGPSTPIPESSDDLPTLQVPEVCPSPIDIARAFMGSRMSDQTHGPNSFLIKDKPEPVHDIYALKPVATSPSSKPATCWPGSLVPEQPGTVTPQSQRGRFGFHEFPRTPYSRSSLSKSISKSQADSRGLGFSVKPFPQSQTSRYEQARKKNDVYNCGYGSAGPIRRIRNRFDSELHHRVSVFLNSSEPSHSPFEKPTDSKTFLPSVGKNMEIGESSGTSISNIKGGHAFPSEATTRMIMDHLNRHKPTPKEKAAELKLATDWNKLPGVEVSDARPNESALLPHLGDSQVNKWTDLVNPESLKVRDSDKDNYQVKPKERSSSVAQNNGQNIATTSGTKPTLPFISISKPDPRCADSSDNIFGFTFPVPESSGSEPPTPSMASFSASVVPPSIEPSPAAPYSFGTTKSSSRQLVFSFPSSSSAVKSHTSGIQFHFGADRKTTTRLSFSAVGKAVC